MQGRPTCQLACVPNVARMCMNSVRCLQLMSLLRDYDVTWPSSTIQLLSYSDSLNLGISITAPQCFVPGYNFFVFYIATMAQPVGLFSG